MIQAKLRGMADIRLLVNRRETTAGAKATGVVTDSNIVVKTSTTETSYQSVDAAGNLEVRDTSTSYTYAESTQDNYLTSAPGWETNWASNNYKKPENVAWFESNTGLGGTGTELSGAQYPTTNLWVYGDIGVPKDNPVSVFLKGTVDPVLDQVVAGTTLAKTSIDVVGKVAGGFVNPANALIKAGVEAARNFLQNSLGVGLHALFLDVPYGLYSGFKQPDTAAYKRFGSEMWPFGTPPPVEGAQVDTSQGGGAPGLLKLVEESLRDTGDDHRPVFPGATAYLGLTVVVGTDVPGDWRKTAEALKTLLKLGSKTFGTNPFTNVREPGSDPEVRPVELTATRMGPGVLLRWRDTVQEYPHYRLVGAEGSSEWAYKSPPSEFRIWGTCDAATSLTSPESAVGQADPPIPSSPKWVLLGLEAGEEGAVLLNAVDVAAGLGSGIGIGNSAAPRYYFRVRQEDLDRLDAAANGKTGRGPYYFAVQHVYKNTVTFTMRAEAPAGPVEPYDGVGSVEPIPLVEGGDSDEAAPDKAAPDAGNVSAEEYPLLLTDYARVTYTPKPTAPSNGVAPDWWSVSVSMSDAPFWDRTIGSLPDFIDAQLLRPLTEDLTDINDGLQKYLKQTKQRVDDFEDTVAQVKQVSGLIQELMNLRVGAYARAFQTVASPAQLDALYNDGDWASALFSGVSENPDGTGEMTRPAPKVGLEALLQEYKESLSQLPFQKDTDMVGALFVVVPLPATPGAELEKIVNAWNTLMKFIGLSGQQLGQLGKDWENWGLDWKKMYEREAPPAETEPDVGQSQGAVTDEYPLIGEDDVWARDYRPDTDCNCPPKPDFSRLAMTDSFQVVRPPLPPLGQSLATINITHRFTRSR